jgi:hypothetical protein
VGFVDESNVDETRAYEVAVFVAERTTTVIDFS